METKDRLEAIFRDLSRGRHLSVYDGETYADLNTHADEYKTLFRRLGFELVQDARGYFYFHGSSRGVAGNVQRLALFIYILIDWLADNGENITDAMAGRTFDIDKLPHLTSDRYRDYLKHVEVDSREGLVDIVRALDNFGFAREQNGVFSFLPPIYRIIDACLASGMDIAKEEAE